MAIVCVVMANGAKTFKCVADGWWKHLMEES